MKIGILGTGMIVKDLCTTIDLLKFESISILGTLQTKEETEALADAHNMTIYYDYDELLNSDVDTIYVALPNFLHYSFSKKALEAGKHVIIEKPITANYKELEELKGIAKERKLMILEAMNIHYLPSYKSIKENMKSVGKLKIVNLNYSQYSSRYNAFKEGTILPAFDYTKAGGALYDINVYNVHSVIGLFGEPKSVRYNANIEKQIDTSGILTLEYETFQAVCIGAKDCKAPVMCTFQGDQGNIVVTTPMSQARSYTVNSNTGDSEELIFNEEDHRLLYEFNEFIRIIDELDYDKMNEMLEISSITSRVMEEARKQEGIAFTNDK